MRRDPIVEEIRASRKRHAAQFDFDLRRIFEDLRARQQATGRNVVTRPPKKIPKQSSATGPGA